MGSSRPQAILIICFGVLCVTFLCVAIGCAHDPIPPVFTDCEAERVALYSFDSNRRYVAARRLRACDTDDVFETLVHRSYEERDEAVGQMIATAIKYDNRSTARVSRMLESRESTLRFRAVMALHKPPPPKLDFMFFDSDQYVVMAYAYTLAGYAPERINPHIERQRDGEVRGYLYRFSQVKKPRIDRRPTMQRVREFESRQYVLPN